MAAAAAAAADAKALLLAAAPRASPGAADSAASTQTGRSRPSSSPAASDGGSVCEARLLAPPPPSLAPSARSRARARRVLAAAGALNAAVAAAAPLPPTTSTVTSAALVAHWGRACGGSPSGGALALALHLFRRVESRLCPATLTSAGARCPRRAGLAACLWVAAKAVDARGAAPRGAALALLAGASVPALAAAELHVLQLVDWAPLAGLGSKKTSA
jgi:hypothetical protein